MSENTRDAVRAIAAAPAHRQANMINDFLAARMGLFRSIARHLCVKYGASIPDHIEDFASLVSMDAYKLVMKQIADPVELERVEVWEAMLRVISRATVRGYLDKDGTPGSGMSSTMRRVRLLNATREAMRRDEGREPTDQEVVDTHNALMWKNRADPVKQGVIATVADLSVHRESVDVTDYDQDCSQPIDTEFVLHPVEGPRFIKTLVARTAEYNPTLGTAADLWLSGLYAEDRAPRIATVKEIAEAMDVTEAQARSFVRKIKEHAIRVAEEVFGITADDL